MMARYMRAEVSQKSSFDSADVGSQTHCMRPMQIINDSGEMLRATGMICSFTSLICLDDSNFDSKGGFF